MSRTGDETQRLAYQASDYSVGDEVPYQITVTVPKNIAELTNL